MSAPYVTLKLATSLDGRIALSNGESQWITSSDARARGHVLRAAHDAILTGVATVLADDPLLTARIVPPPARQPLRIVADSSARTPLTARLLNSPGGGPVIIATCDGVETSALKAAGAAVWQCGKGPRVSPVEILRRAEAEGIKTLMIECGGVLAASFLRAGLIDELAWFRAPVLIGAEGLPGIGALALQSLGAASHWRLHAAERIGDDTFETYRRA